MSAARPTVSTRAIGLTYVVERRGRKVAVVSREEPDGTAVVLERFERLRRSDWTRIARCILVDAIDVPHPTKLARDYGRFLVVAPDSTLRVGGGELQEWLDTWEQEGVWGLFKSRR